MKHPILFHLIAMFIVVSSFQVAFAQATLIPNAVKDIEGNSYSAVRIGQQVWMAENMRATKDRDGNIIALGSNCSDGTPYRYYPDGFSTNVEKYGYLYNWVAAMKVCPKGWHLPTDAEWKQLEMTMGMSASDVDEFGDRGPAIAIKLCGDGWWEDSSEAGVVGDQSAEGRNLSGFCALPAGKFSDKYQLFGGYAFFWSATDVGYYAYVRDMGYNHSNVGYSAERNNNGLSVRCLRNK